MLQDIFTTVLVWIDPIIKYMLLHRRFTASWVAKLPKVMTSDGQSFMKQPFTEADVLDDE